jgi:XTP/dITP diphosphohydrolase
MPSILVATKNAHKTAEIRAILGPDGQVTDLTAHPDIPAPEESGATFTDNAHLKALAAAQIFPGLVLADDSGLEVDALGGAPGVLSARYAGRDASDASNREKLLAALANIPGATRTARFRCVITLAQGGRVLHTCSGAVEGTLLRQEQGTGGFGYDSLFVPQGYDRTFAELSAEVKNRHSHRARALAQMLEYFTRISQ